MHIKFKNAPSVGFCVFFFHCVQLIEKMQQPIESRKCITWLSFPFKPATSTGGITNYRKKSLGARVKTIYKKKTTLKNINKLSKAHQSAPSTVLSFFIRSCLTTMQFFLLKNFTYNPLKYC